MAVCPKAKRRTCRCRPNSTPRPPPLLPRTNSPSTAISPFALPAQARRHLAPCRPRQGILPSHRDAPRRQRRAFSLDPGLQNAVGTPVPVPRAARSPKRNADSGHPPGCEYCVVKSGVVEGYFSSLTGTSKWAVFTTPWRWNCTHNWYHARPGERHIELHLADSSIGDKRMVVDCCRSDRRSPPACAPMRPACFSNPSHRFHLEVQQRLHADDRLRWIGR